MYLSRKRGARGLRGLGDDVSLSNTFSYLTPPPTGSGGGDWGGETGSGGGDWAGETGHPDKITAPAPGATNWADQAVAWLNKNPTIVWGGIAGLFVLSLLKGARR